jgi:threonine dehydrogenase-like Zn-dependent dehydrogenase
LLERIENGDIDPSFVITHTAPLEKGPELYQPVDEVGFA